MNRRGGCAPDVLHAHRRETLVSLTCKGSHLTVSEVLHIRDVLVLVLWLLRPLLHVRVAVHCGKASEVAIDQFLTEHRVVKGLICALILHLLNRAFLGQTQVLVGALDVECLGEDCGVDGCECLLVGDEKLNQVGLVLGRKVTECYFSVDKVAQLHQGRLDRGCDKVRVTRHEMLAVCPNLLVQLLSHSLHLPQQLLLLAKLLLEQLALKNLEAGLVHGFNQNLLQLAPAVPFRSELPPFPCCIGTLFFHFVAQPLDHVRVVRLNALDVVLDLAPDDLRIDTQGEQVF